jgi:hypothetical protein
VVIAPWNKSDIKSSARTAAGACKLFKQWDTMAGIADLNYVFPEYVIALVIIRRTVDVLDPDGQSMLAYREIRHIGAGEIKGSLGRD